MPHSNSTQLQSRQLVLVKQDQRWVFRYQVGEEKQILHCLAETARDSQYQFDWFDAAVLSHQMGDKLGEQLKQLMIQMQSIDR